LAVKANGWLDLWDWKTLRRCDYSASEIQHQNFTLRVVLWAHAADIVFQRKSRQGARDSNETPALTRRHRNCHGPPGPVLGRLPTNTADQKPWTLRRSRHLRPWLFTTTTASARRCHSDGTRWQLPAMFMCIVQ